MKTFCDRVLSAGCLALFVMFLGATVWSIVGGWQHSIWIGVTVLAGLLLERYSSYRLRQFVQNFLNSAFQSRGVEPPKLRFAGGYGYPGYTLTFSSKEAELAAINSGALLAFKASIQEYHRDAGSKMRLFDVDLAVHTEYPNKPLVQSDRKDCSN